MKKIVVAHGHSSIEILHSLTPIILSSKINDKWNIQFVDYKISNIFKKSGDILILVRKYHNKKISDTQMLEELKILKKNFSKIVYFDDSASSSMIYFNIFKYVDRYWKRSIFNDLNLYKNKLYGGRLFSDYYHKNYNISDSKNQISSRVSDKDTDFQKLRIAWNIGIGVFPLNKFSFLDKNYNFVRRLITSLSILPNIDFIYSFIFKNLNRMKNELKKNVEFKQRQLKFSSRFEYSIYSNTVGYQRNLLLKKISNNNNFLKTKLNRTKFTNETFNIFGILSPFGWGEICYRDFEALIGGAYLIKPDTSHINTWPNIFNSNMYHSLSWDFKNVEQLIDLFNKTEKCQEAVNSARKLYLDALDNVTSRCIELINEL